MMSKILQPTPQNIKEAAQRLRDGYLVAIPTETVYGLGANALNDEACRKVYKVKGRPVTDPLICHVSDIKDALSLWDDGHNSGNTKDNMINVPDKLDYREVIRLAEHLGRSFWPGPLTIVARAASHVPSCVTGGSGLVGVRIPNHNIALELLKLAEVPVAAPSANIFGHVSPTTAQHVFDDLCIRDPELTVLDGGCCGIGIESTVVKLTLAPHVTSCYSESSNMPLTSVNVEVLRRGKVSVSEIQSALEKFPNAVTNVGEIGSVTTGELPLSKPVGSISPYLNVRDTRSKYLKETEIMDGPGQLLTHYSPNIPCYLLTPVEVRTLAEAAVGNPGKHAIDICISMGPTAPSIYVSRSENSKINASSSLSLSSPKDGQLCDNNTNTTQLSTVIVLDFADVLKPIIPSPTNTDNNTAVRYIYRSLSQSGDVEEACKNVFDALRWTETVCKTQSEKGEIKNDSEQQQNVVVFFPLLSEWDSLVKTSSNELLYAVEDRLFRAASGKVATIITTDFVNV